MKAFPPHPLTNRLRFPVTSVTAYDYPSARLCDEAGVQMILVGDSLGMMVAGCPDTTSVTLEQMVYHTEIVRRGVKRAVVLSDLPINTYRNPGEALHSARRLIDAGAEAVKLEGGYGQIEKIAAIVDAGIPLCAHLGMLPQRVREEGGYRKKGRSVEEAERLLGAALALEAAGAFAVVLESVVADVASEITRRLRIPTIGIGSGGACDGQVRVLHDVTGAFPWFVPPFAKVYGNVAEITREALSEYVRDVEAAPDRPG